MNKDPEYLQAQKDLEERQSQNKLAALAAGIGDAFARKDSGNTDRYFQNVNQNAIDSTIGEYARRKEGAKNDMKFAQQEALKDPNSQESINFRNLVQSTMPNIVKGYGDKWNKVAAADQDSILNFGKMREQLDARMDLNRQNQEAKQSKEKDMKASQAQALSYGKRIEQSEEVFNNLAASGYDRSGVMAGIGASLPNVMKSSEAQQQAQAERNFVNAVLRRESGSAIAPSEFASAEMQYFPRSGDNEEVLAQKKANRQQVLASLKAEAGEKNWDKVERIPTATESKPTSKQKAAPASDGRITVSNGKETFKVLPEDLQDALKDGFQEVGNE